ncbi:hypothetical protein MY10362_008737 [Beauveria mimosiformis]
MEVPSLPSRVHEEVGSKRKLNPEDGTPAKRRQLLHRGGTTRPTTSGELLWGPSYSKSIYCSEEDKAIFRIHFRKRRTEVSATEAKSSCHATRRSIVKELTYYGDATSKGMVALLSSYGLRPRNPKLHLRYRGSTSVVEADGLFHVPSTRSEIAFIDFTKMAERRAKHPMTLLPEAKREKQEFSERRAEEHLRIKPKKAEEDAQIALIMVAMAQKILRSADRKQPANQKQPADHKQLGAWARVIGLGGGNIFMYRSWVPRRFVDTFKPDKRFVVDYRSISLGNGDRVVEQLDRLLTERSPPNVQPLTAAAAQH